MKRASEIAFPDRPNGIAQWSFLTQLAANLVERGRARARDRDFAGAVPLLRDAALLAPHRAETWHNLGEGLFHAGRFDEGIEAYRRAVEANPNLDTAWLGWASCNYQTGRFHEAVGILEEALKIHDDNIKVHYALAQVLLLLGHFARGWPEYERRFLAPTENGEKVASLAQIGPVWRGEPLAGKTVLLHTEQGFGDAIQFARFVRWLKRERAAAHVHVNCHAQLFDLFRHLDGVDLLSKQDEEACPPFDFHLAAMSIPSVIGLTDETTPAAVPYFHLPADLVARYALSKGRVNVGLCWQGRKEHGNDRQRSMNAELLAPLAEVPGVRFHSLQIGMPSPGWMIAPPFADSDWLATAAQIANLDLVIAVDTAVAHLAGALGVPVWLLTAFAPDWRWQLDRSDSPWYPKHRLYRQNKPRDWGPVIKTLSEDLLAFAMKLFGGTE